MGAENLCHQAIFVNHATSAVTPLDPEMVQVGEPVWRRVLDQPGRRGDDVAMMAGAMTQQMTMAIVYRGLTLAALNTPRSWTRLRVAMSTELSTPSAASTATSSASGRIDGAERLLEASVAASALVEFRAGCPQSLISEDGFPACSARRRERDQIARGLAVRGPTRGPWAACALSTALPNARALPPPQRRRIQR